MSTRAIEFVILVVTGFVLSCEGKQCYEQCTTTMDAEYTSVDSCIQTSTTWDCDGDPETLISNDTNCNTGYRVVQANLKGVNDGGNLSSDFTWHTCFSLDITPHQDYCVTLEGMDGLKPRFQEAANSFGKNLGDNVPITGTVCFCQTEPCTEAPAGTGEVTAGTGSPEAIMTTDSGACKQDIIYKLGLLFTAVAFVLLTNRHN